MSSLVPKFQNQLAFDAARPADVIGKVRRRQLNTGLLRQIADQMDSGNVEAVDRMLADINQRLGGFSIGSVICGRTPPPDHRRPIVTESHTIPATAVAAAADALAALTGVFTVPTDLEFLRATQNPPTFVGVNAAAVAPLMRPQVFERYLTGLEVRYYFHYQPNPGGNAAPPDPELSEWISDYLRSVTTVSIFSSSSRTPHMEATPVYYFDNGGELLPDTLAVPFDDDNARVRLLLPGNADAIGSPALPVWTDDAGAILSGSMLVSGLFVSDKPTTTDVG
jgi:hypothetical protein